ncbi:MAG: SGNH/GDSL hydrolase family protein [Lachnospiraceae bacterium]|nr:SGNH/GDSL hydrolase family protein [Lachnospiraceae bacterium]
MKRILFQGDSITDAGRARENPANMGKGYPLLVTGVLGADEPGKYEFLNRGIGGNRVVDVYARIKADIINLKPDILSILIGVNDIWSEITREDGVDTEKYFKIYSMLIEEIQSALPEVKIMILEPFVLKGSATAAEWERFHSEVEARAKKSKEIAEKYHLKFIPLQDKFDEAERKCSAEYWLKDGVHPTTMGHEIIKREWLKAFEELK